MAHSYNFFKKKVNTWQFPEKTSWLLPRKNKSSFIAGCKSGIYILDLFNSTRKKILDIENTIPNNRFNDAKVDRSGRIWAGSMDDNEKLKTGWLYRIDSNLNFTKCDGPYVITNGPAMNFEGNILYHVDTLGKCVYKFELKKDGKIENKNLLIKLEDNDGFPDGLTVDKEGYIWLAHWGGGKITRFKPSGNVDYILKLPVPQVTSCVFGGPDMNILFITTASRGLDTKKYALSLIHI